MPYGEGSLSLLGTQWRLCRIQLINWGTFDGYNNLRIRPSDDEGAASVVCITGRSGTGKSTLFDAGTVLMMPYGRTLNAASNLGRGGSPREVRTYLRGMIDTVADERGRTRGKFLRDDGQLIWSAIVHTWEDTTGAIFSAARFFTLRPGGGDNDLDQTLVTMEGHLDPRALRSYATGRIRARDVRQVYPGCVVHEGSGRFFRAIYLTLGIGEQGNGSNAMKLMYRIQSGIPMTNVDDLFKELVLDPPSTFELAQAVVDCFDQNENVWHRIEEARRKRAMLAGIDDAYARMLAAAEGTRLVESLEHESQQGPLALWLGRHKLDLALAEQDGTQRSLDRERNALVTTEQRRAEHEAELEQLRQSIYAHGGDDAERLRAQLASERAQHEVVQRRRGALGETLRASGRELPDTREGWDELVTWGGEVMRGYQHAADELQERIDETGVRLAEATRAMDKRREDLDYYRAHRTRITRHMARARNLMAQAAGLDPTDIPFAAELMDVPREQELWRVAVNVSLVRIADRIMVDKALEGSFRRAVDGLAGELGRRYHYDFVDLDKDYLCAPKPGHVSSKVVYRDDSPFAPYVRSLVCASTDHQCVDTVGQLAGQGPRITVSGQERVGNRGAIGHGDGALIIGFSNEMLIQDLEAELENAQAELGEIRRQRDDLRRRRRRLDADERAARRVAELAWDEIDAAGIGERIARLEADLARLEQDDELRALMQMRDEMKQQVEADIGRLHELEGSIGQYEQYLAGLVRLVEETRSFVGATEALGVGVTSEQGALAQEAVAQAEATLGDRAAILRRYARLEGQARAHLEGLLDARRAEHETCRASLERTFGNYHATFMPEDAEHGTTVEEYPFYHAALAELEQQRLDEPETEWEAEMLRDVAQHLSRLQDAFVTEERALADRLRPVNEILGQFAFGERRGRLSVVSERRTLSDVTAFRRTLRRLCGLATTFDFAGGEAEVQREHRVMERFVGVLRADLAKTGKDARHYLDTRHMVRISARETVPGDPSAEPVVYDSINGKSGGQYQELVAFILGAALLYCLGYNAATMPSYAPLYLDEAFIKADSDHTRRALGALSGLGFQVIIAVPDGKVEAVAPLASQIISLTKDVRTGTTRTRSLLRAGTDESGDPQWQD